MWELQEVKEAEAHPYPFSSVAHYIFLLSLHSHCKMRTQSLEPIIHPPPSPPQPLASNRLNRPTSLSFHRPKPTHQPMHISLPTKNTHLSILDKPVDSNTYASILESCKCPSLGKQIHAHSLKTGFHGHEFIETKLLQMYGRCGCLECAYLLFETMPLRNLYSWTAILNVCVDNEFFEEALLLFQELQFEDIGLEFFVFPVVFKICSGLDMVELGRQLHGIVVKYHFASNIYVGNALIDMYGKCKSLDDAKKVLEMMPKKDCVSWNSIVTACATNGMVYEALEFLERMSLEDSVPNLVSWSAVIGGFSQNGYDEEAIELLYRMQEAGFGPNARTLASVLPACARLEKLSLGKEIHGYITRHEFMSNPFVVNGLVDVYRRGLQSNTFVGGALVEMYCKCHSLAAAQMAFDAVSERDIATWNALISGYAYCNEKEHIQDLIQKMKGDGFEPNVYTWNGIIAGYVVNEHYDSAMKLFTEMLTSNLRPDIYTVGIILPACSRLATIERAGEEKENWPRMVLVLSVSSRQQWEMPLRVTAL
ncbi:pentatricopeptide repeat-containing protein At2g13600-like [Fagus crenata]